MGLQELHYGTWQHSSEDYKANRQSDRRSTPLTSTTISRTPGLRLVYHLLRAGLEQPRLHFVLLSGASRRALGTLSPQLVLRA